MLSDRIWPSGTAQKALGAILTPSEPIEAYGHPDAAVTTPEPIEAPGSDLPADLVERLASIGRWTADYDYEYEYGYGGELYEYRSVSNWEEIVVAILTAAQGVDGECDPPSQPHP